MKQRSSKLLTLLLLLLIPGCYSPPAENALTGKTEDAVRAQFGQPHHEFAGHYAAPPESFTQQFTGPIKTLVFAKPGGELYVSFERRNGSWIAICNSWLRSGAAF